MTINLNFTRSLVSTISALALLGGLVACEAKPAAEDPAAKAPLKEEIKKEVSSIVVYSGRNESLVGPLLKEFQEKNKVELKIKYGKTAALSALLLEEGDKSPAAIFLAQDAGALGALSKQNRFVALDSALSSRVPASYKDPQNKWLGVTGRSRAVVYNTKAVKADALPKTVFELTDKKYKGRVGWAPANGSFQAFVTAMRKMHGEDKTKAWLVAMKKNGAKEYPKNSAIVRATGAGEVDLGLVNHYYLYRFTKDDKDFAANNHYTEAGSVGALVNVSGAGVLKSASEKEQALAKKLLAFLLSDAAQASFANNTHEYPVVASVAGPKDLPSLSERKPPALNLSDLDDLQGTLKLLRDAGVVP